MATVNLSVINVERITEINLKLMGLQQATAGVKPEELRQAKDGNQVKKEDLEKYNKLLRLRQLISVKDISDKKVMRFEDLAYIATDDKEIRELYLESGLELRVPQAIQCRGIIPGLKIQAPLPIAVGQPIENYERYLENYYANVGVKKQTKNGIRLPYPHEQYVWENGVAHEPDGLYTNEYYFGKYLPAIKSNQYTESNPNSFDQQQAQQAQAQAQAQQQRRANIPNQQQATQAQTQQPQQPGQAQQTQYTGRRTLNRQQATNGRQRFSRRTLNRGVNAGNIFERIAGKVYDFDRALATPQAGKNVKKIIKTIGLVLLAAAAIGLGGAAIYALGSGIISSFGGVIASGNASLISGLVGKILAAGLGVTIAAFFGNYVAKRRRAREAKPDEEGAPEGGGQNPPTAPNAPQDDPDQVPTFTTVEELTSYVARKLREYKVTPIGLNDVLADLLKQPQYQGE